MEPVRFRAFSLIELLAVIAIIGVLAALALPSTVSMLQGSKIDRAANQLAQAFSNARLRAITDNERVMLAFFELEDANGNLEFNAHQLVKRLGDGVIAPIGAIERFPTSVVLSQDAELSSLDEISEFTTANDLGVVPEGSVGRFIVFRPDGSTSLPLRSNDPNYVWFLTLVDEKFADSSELPSNYAVVQFDPIVGSTKIYRP